MITVETKDPVVFSNAEGDKKTKRQERITKLQERGRRWDEAGVFGALKNLALTPKGETPSTTTTLTETPVYEVPAVEDTKQPMNKYLKWSLIIGGVALVGFGVYYFGFRKKAK